MKKYIKGNINNKTNKYKIHNIYKSLKAYNI